MSTPWWKRWEDRQSAQKAEWEARIGKFLTTEHQLFSSLPDSLNQIGRQFNAYSGAKLAAVDGIQRAQEELDEAREECVGYGAPSPEFITECADVVLTLAAVCEGLGLDLDAAVAKKHAVNMTRQWGLHPSIKGGVKRIKPVNDNGDGK